jgi:hypothetical protein
VVPPAAAAAGTAAAAAASTPRSNERALALHRQRGRLLLHLRAVRRLLVRLLVVAAVLRV